MPGVVMQIINLEKYENNVKIGDVWKKIVKPALEEAIIK